MDYFEQIAIKYYESKGYWTRCGYKIELEGLDPATRAGLVKPTDPRPEIDVIAFKPGGKELLIIECKSFLDSGGIKDASFEEGHKHNKRYKLFTDRQKSDALKAQLIKQLVKEELLINDKARTQLVLFAGNVHGRDAEKLKKRFKDAGWQLVDQAAIVAFLEKLSTSRYENDPITIVSKLLLRNRVKE